MHLLHLAILRASLIPFFVAFAVDINAQGQNTEPLIAIDLLYKPENQFCQNKLLFFKNLKTKKDDIVVQTF